MRVFVIMPFRNTSCAEIYDDVIKPVFKNENCDVVRADVYSQQRSIIKDIVHGLAKADLVLADLTGLNANVLYELGLAHAFLKPTLVITQDALDDLPFDLGSYRTHKYSLHHKDVKELEEKLRQVVKNFNENNLSAENPVTDFLANYSISFDNRSNAKNRLLMTGVVERDMVKALSAKETVEIARHYLNTRDSVTALEIAEIGIEKWAKNDDLYRILGRASINLAQSEKAIQYGTKLAELEPLDHEGFSLIGDGYRQLSEWEQAIPYFEKALKVATKPFQPHLHRDLAVCYEKLGNLVHSIVEYKEAANGFEDAGMRDMCMFDVTRLEDIRRNLS